MTTIKLEVFPEYSDETKCSETCPFMIREREGNEYKRRACRIFGELQFDQVWHSLWTASVSSVHRSKKCINSAR